MISISINGVDVFLEESEKSLQINNINEKDINNIWETLIKSYPRHKIDFCFKDVPLPMDKLSQINATILDDCINMNLAPEDYKACDNHHVLLLAEEDFEIFANFYDSCEMDMDWSSRQIKKRLDIWRIFVTKVNGEISGYITLMIPLKDANLNVLFYGEIFAVNANSPDNHKALISAAAKYSFESRKREVVYMVDICDTKACDAALAVGFKTVGFYKSYRAVIPG